MAIIKITEFFNNENFLKKIRMMLLDINGRSKWIF